MQIEGLNSSAFYKEMKRLGLKVWLVCMQTCEGLSRVHWAALLYQKINFALYILKAYLK